MKSEQKIKEMACAIFNVKTNVPGMSQHEITIAQARLEGMQLALAWTLQMPLPKSYTAWFKRLAKTVIIRKPDERSLSE